VSSPPLGIDVDRLRRETPGCRRWAHFNNAGASLMPAPVTDTVTEHLRLESETGGYEAAGIAADRLEAVYDSVAALLGAQRDEIALVDNATRAFNAVLYALPWRAGDRILTGRAEYASNYMAYLHLKHTRGVEVDVVPDDAHGQIDVAALKQRIDERAALIALTHVPTSGGLVNPAAEVGAVARAAGVPFLLDACQSVGQMPTRVDELGCDFLSATGRKFLRGPRGTGLLYVRRDRAEALHPPELDLGGADWTALDSYTLKAGARRFETWEAAHALRLGLGRAIDYALEIGLDAIWARITALATRLRCALDESDAVTLHDLGATRCGIVSFSVAGAEPDAVKARLAERGIHVELSFVEDTRLDLEDRGLERFVRASAHCYNTEHEVDRLAAAVAEIGQAAPRRSMRA
jgi:selenocysteine lyase/cysteine desulfurase